MIMTALAIGVVLWCMASLLKTYPRPGYARVFLFDRLTRDYRSYRSYRTKCNRYRTDGPTPCYCCRNKCYGPKDGSRYE